VLRLAAGTEQRKLEPAEVEAVSGRPNHRADTGVTQIELADRRRNAWRFRILRVGFRFVGTPNPFLTDITVDLVEKSLVSGVSIRQALFEIAGKMNDAFPNRLESAEKSHALCHELAEIDGVAAISSSDERQGGVGPALLDGRLIEAHFF
jgi:hypothetical protein